MAGSTCHCEAPATRLLRVVARNDEGEQTLRSEHGRSVAQSISRQGDPGRPSSWACCERDRHAVREYLLERWADEITRGEVKVLMGKRRKAGF